MYTFSADSSLVRCEITEHHWLDDQEIIRVQNFATTKELLPIIISGMGYIRFHIVLLWYLNQNWFETYETSCKTSSLF